MLWPHSCLAVLLPALILLWCGCVESAPTFGLLGLLTGASSSTNSTGGLLETLALSHLQHKINTLEVLADLLTIAANSSSGFLG